MHDGLRIAVIVVSAAFAVWLVAQMWMWHNKPDSFDIRDLFMSLGKDKKQHVSRVAVAEMVALFATTSGYLGVMAVKPEMYETCTLVYAGTWVTRGAFSTYLKSKFK